MKVTPRTSILALREYSCVGKRDMPTHATLWKKLLGKRNSIQLKASFSTNRYRLDPRKAANRKYGEARRWSSPIQSRSVAQSDCLFIRPFSLLCRRWAGYGPSDAALVARSGGERTRGTA